MDDVSTLRLHEVQTYFSVVAGLTDERTIRARSFHNLGVFGHDDYVRLADTLEALDASATVAVLGRDVDELAPTIEALNARGHEIALHGYRHVACLDVPYDVVHENVSRGLDAVEDATGIRPDGYFPPLQDLGADALQVASEVGLEWIFGTTAESVPESLTLVDPVNPYDMGLARESDAPETALEPLFDRIEAGNTFLFHPNMLEYFGATEQFHDWLEAARPVSVARQIDAGGVGVVIDANRPLRIE